MKSLVSLIIMTFLVSCNADKPDKAFKVETAQVSADGKEEDCDEKAKMPIEIKEETISLSGDSGCSLDELEKLAP